MKKCTWTQQDGQGGCYSDTYETGCDKLFVLISETPETNGMKFCCYCGGELRQVLVPQDDRYAN